MNWKVLAGVLLVLYVSVTNTKEIRDTATNIQNGLSSAKEASDHIVDKRFINQYKAQAGLDIDSYLIKHPKTTMNNNDFNNAMYAFLAKKYYWRDWFIVTYNDITGGNVHWVGQCDGFTKFRNHGRNVMVASVDQKKGHINMAQAKTIVNNVDSCHSNKRTDCDKAYKSFPASVRDHCSPYSAKGVIAYTKHNGNDVHFKAAANRMYVRSQENCNFVFIFG